MSIFIIIIAIYYIWVFSYIVAAESNYELKVESNYVYQIGIGEGGIGPGLLPRTEQNKSCEINQIPS